MERMGERGLTVRYAKCANLNKNMNEENNNRKPETERRLVPCVPQWWWDYGLQHELDKRQREGVAFDCNISNASKAPNVES
jgi:hypothetical protein